METPSTLFIVQVQLKIKAQYKGNQQVLIVFTLIFLSRWTDEIHITTMCVTELGVVIVVTKESMFS